MKKLVCLLLAAVGMTALASCSSVKEPAPLRRGVYVSGSGEGEIYASFAADGSWVGGTAEGMRSTDGEWTANGKTVTAQTTYPGGKTGRVTFEAASETEITVTAVDWDPERDPWTEVGDVYTLYTPDADFMEILSADRALAEAKRDGLPVMEGLRVTSGQESWDAFYAKVTAGEPASVLYLSYYTLDPAHVSEELYAKEKDRYPMAFYSWLEYDGEKFTYMVRMTTEEAIEERSVFPYLLHFTGDAPQQAAFSHYDRYVLSDDPTVTWEQIESAMFSSVYEESRRFRTRDVYTNLID